MVRVVVVAHPIESGHVNFEALVRVKEPGTISLTTTNDIEVGAIECDSEGEAALLVEVYNAHPKRLSGGDISLSQVLDKVRGVV